MTQSGKLSAVVLFGCISQVLGHGFLYDPPARNTIWREGFPNPVNYNDMGLNCGGMSNQYDVHNGKCGVCGDPYQGPRKHEAGYPGGYANGIIGKHYKMGQVINVQAKITANHKGHVVFKICPVNNKNIKVTQDCLDRYPLADVNGNKKFSVYDQIGNQPGMVKASLVLPKHLTCSQCVIQWYYTSGNNVGPPGTPQESFVNCADVEISKSGGPDPTPPPPTINRKPDYKTDNNGRPVLGTLWDCNLVPPNDVGKRIQNTYDWCMDNCIRAPPQSRACPADVCRCFITEGMTTWPQTTTPGPISPEDKRDPAEWTCKLVSPHDNSSPKKVRSLTQWCTDNCIIAHPRHRNCPSNMCNCYKDGRTTTTTTPPPPGPRDPAKWRCDVVPPYNRANTANGIRRWCMNNCVHASEAQRFCPPSHCNCYFIGQNGQRMTTMRPQSSDRFTLFRGKRPYLNDQGICTLVRDRDENARNSQSTRKWCADTCIPKRQTWRSSCNTSKCDCDRF